MSLVLINVFAESTSGDSSLILMLASFVASFAIGAVVGLICVTIFGVVLRRIEQDTPKDAVGTLMQLIAWVLGGGAADYVIFDWILSTDGAISFYLIGFAVLFLAFGIPVFRDWKKP